MKYYKHSIKTMDEYFMFRKQFTQYYASNAFISHVLRLNDHSPSNLKICSRHAKVFHSECKLNLDSSRADSEPPFRMSKDIQEFITPMGMDGLFPNTMTSCSLAIRDVRHYLRTIFYLEEFMQVNKINHDQVEMLVDDAIERIDYFAKPYLDKQYSSQLRKFYMDEDQAREETEKLEQAELDLKKDRFNKPAYDLIQEAIDKC